MRSDLRCCLTTAVMAALAWLLSCPLLGQAQPTKAIPQEVAVKKGDAPLVVTSSRLDLNGDGKPDTVRIELIEGRRYVDTEVWCGEGPKIEGRFQLVVELSGHEPRNQDLNALLHPFEPGQWQANPGESIPGDWFGLSLGTGLRGSQRRRSTGLQLGTVRGLQLR